MNGINLAEFAGDKTDKTFKIRYIEDDQWFNSEEALQKKLPRPILLFTGGEADIYHWYNATGFQTHTLAQKYGGLVVVTEHRYFGESKPFGAESLKKGNVQFLSTENALMDVANLIKHI